MTKPRGRYHKEPSEAFLTVASWYAQVTALGSRKALARRIGISKSRVDQICAQIRLERIDAATKK